MQFLIASSTDAAYLNHALHLHFADVEGTHRESASAAVGKPHWPSLW